MTIASSVGLRLLIASSPRSCPNAIIQGKSWLLLKWVCVEKNLENSSTHIGSHVSHFYISVLLFHHCLPPFLPLSTFHHLKTGFFTVTLRLEHGNNSSQAEILWSLPWWPSSATRLQNSTHQPLRTSAIAFLYGAIDNYGYILEDRKNRYSCNQGWQHTCSTKASLSAPIP